jgi:hypothetical protein
MCEIPDLWVVRDRIQRCISGAFITQNIHHVKNVIELFGSSLLLLYIQLTVET